MPFVRATFSTLRRIGLAPIRGPRLHGVGRVIVLAALVGVAAGVGTALFHGLCNLAVQFSLVSVVGYDPGGPHGSPELFASGESTVRTLTPWLLLVVPTVGGLISGWLVYTFAPEADGGGTDAAIDAYHNRRGAIRKRVPLVKMVASAITIGTGGSGGREGPIAQIGAGIGSMLATRLRLSDAERRTLLAAGMGAGIGALFHAPLAGAIFAIEVLYRDPDFEAEVLIPAFIATTVAYCVFHLTMLALNLHAFTELFAVPPPDDLRFNDPALLLPLTALALVMVVASLVYVRTFHGISAVFARWRFPRRLKPAVGAFGSGLIAVIAYYAVRGLYDQAGEQSLGMLSFGYGFLQQILDRGQFVEQTMNIPNPAIGAAIVVLMVVGVGRIITTSLTIGSGGSGGVFGPSMVIGGSFGAVVGLLFSQWQPQLVGPNEVVMFALLGMAGFFAAAANTPVSTLIMVSEMCGSYRLLLPSMWVCALAYLLSRSWAIFRHQVASRADSPAHRGDFIVDVLEGLTIQDAMTDTGRKFTTVPLDMSLHDVVHMITGTLQSCFPVVDDSGRYHGMFSLNDIRQFLYDTDVGHVAVAQDLAVTDSQPLTLATDLGAAMRRFAVSVHEELPVMDPDEPNTVVGILRRQDVIVAYNARLAAMRNDEDPS